MFTIYPCLDIKLLGWADNCYFHIVQKCVSNLIIYDYLQFALSSWCHMELPKDKAWWRSLSVKTWIGWKIALLRDRSICHPALLGKFGVNMNFRQLLGVICAKNLRESGISSPPWGPLPGIVKKPLDRFICISIGSHRHRSLDLVIH